MLPLQHLTRTKKPIFMWRQKREKCHFPTAKNTKDHNNHTYLKAALKTKTRTADVRRALLCDVAYTPEVKTERAYTDQVILYKNLDILRAALLSARDLRIPHDKVLVVNAASAKTPGGGTFGTGTATEENLCRSSALYLSLCLG